MSRKNNSDDKKTSKGSGVQVITLPSESTSNSISGAGAAANASHRGG